MKFSLLLIFQTVLALWLLTACQPNFLPPISLEETISQINTTSHPRWQRVQGPEPSDWDVFLTPTRINGIAQDAGNIWAASDSGLLRWDRTTGNVDHYIYPAHPLPDNYIGDVLFYDGKLVITGERGVAFFDGKEQWQSFSNEQIGSQVTAASPLMVHNDTLWVGAADGLARYRPDSGWEHIPLSKDMEKFRFLDRLVAEDDAIFVVKRAEFWYDARRSVVRYADGKWTPVDRPELTHLTANGVYYRGNRSLLTQSLDMGQTWQTIIEEPGEFFQAHLVDDAEFLYASQEDKIFVLKNGQVVEHYDFALLGPELSDIHRLEWDDAGRLWIATNGNGLSMYDGDHWHNWRSTTSGLGEDTVRSLGVTNRKVYVGTFSDSSAGGVSILDIASGEWSQLWPGASLLSGGGVGGIVTTEDDRIFFPTEKAILDIYDDGRWVHLSMPVPISGKLRTEDATLDINGDYWLAASDLGVWHFDGRRWEVYSVPMHVWSVAAGPDGSVWIGGLDGALRRKQDGTWELFEQAQLQYVAWGWIQDMYVDGDGRAWATTWAGAFLAFDGEQLTRFSEDMLGVRWGGAVTFDANGQLWVALDNGLAHYKGDAKNLLTDSISIAPMATASDQDLTVLQMLVGQLPTPTPGIPPTVTPMPPTATPRPVDPNVLRPPDLLWMSMACMGCHSLDQPQTPENRGPVGPNLGNLAEVIESRNLEEDPFTHVYNSIVDPSAYVTEGYVPGIMPQTYAETMTDEEIRSLVEWLLSPRDN